MRKLVVSMNITLDGYLSGPRGELDWHFKCWTRDMGHALCRELASADTILLGRKTYNAMAAYWPAKGADPSCHDEDFAYANMMNTYRKIIFSRTLVPTGWSNSKLATRTLENEVRYLKERKGRNIIVYGSGELVHSLIRMNMVDEYQLWLHPVILGSGIRLFGNLPFRDPQSCQLDLSAMHRFASGVVRLQYSAAPNQPPIEKILESISLEGSTAW